MLLAFIVTTKARPVLVNETSAGPLPESVRVEPTIGERSPSCPIENPLTLVGAPALRA